MKEKLFFLGLLLCLLGTNLSAQCEDCGNSGQITETSDDNFSAASADAYFWEICSGNATIVGDVKSKEVEVTCNSGESIIKVTRFVDGECIEACKTICMECECPPVIPNSCLQLTVQECESASATIQSTCLPEPECIDFITWHISLGSYEDEFVDNNTTITFDIPAGDWSNELLVVTATITMTSGEECKYVDEETINCPVCECPSFIPESCMQISLEGCETAFFTIQSQCLPDPECIDFITWQIGLGSYEDEFVDNNTSITYNIPAGDWPNHYLVVTAVITLTSGDKCEYGNRKLIDCPDGSGGHGGGPKNRLLGTEQGDQSLIYPNPIRSGDSIILPATLSKDLKSIDLLDSNGKRVTNLNSNDLEIPENLEPGIYYLNIQQQSGTTVRKIIVQ